MEHTKGNWTFGKRGGTVISDTIPENWPSTTGHDDKDYYGGFLIAESIATKDDAKLIAAAPDLLEALQKLMSVYEQKGQLLSFDVNIAREAIKKATE
jgi:hypothetical protein